MSVGPPRYDLEQSYDWNYEHAPAGAEAADVPSYPGTWDFCGLPVDSPLGIPAGPLLNSRWILYYAGLGFSVLTYKTVRPAFRASYERPNLIPVAAHALTGHADSVNVAPGAQEVESWAISFGMPSKDPATWQEDVTRARKGLRHDQVLSVSVVASPGGDWTLDRIAADFAQCARWAVDAGAQTVEANFSCPNVCTQEGQIYTSREASGCVAARIRSAIGQVPLILKIGLFDNREGARAFVEAVKDYATALSTVNCISAAVSDGGGRMLFGGLTRGIGGRAIRERANVETEMLHGVIAEAGCALRVIGVGGVSGAGDVQERLRAGAHHVQVATAAMRDPLIGVRIRREVAGRM